MTKFKIKDKVYGIPTSWSDVTFSQWLEMKDVDEKDEMKIISILSGIELNDIKRLDPPSQYRLTLALGFLNTPIKIDDYKAPEKLTIKIDHKEIDIKLIENIKKKTFGQKIYFQQILKNNKDDIIEAMIDIILVYSQPQIDGSKLDTERFSDLRTRFKGLKLVDLYSTAMCYVSQLTEIVKTEGKRLSTKPTYEQSLAGVDIFDEFGVMNTVKALAGNDILKYEKVLEMEYNVVLTHLIMSKAENEFQTNYREVIRKRSK